ncbi:beta strand repeat-containing protein, partial [Algibacillus agarilyticus]|uniref:beta strand repeat-containing protein n=1 Tax=Algibacillus agarilyticus TaxID=2234133 RepID=UPI00130051BD
MATEYILKESGRVVEIEGAVFKLENGQLLPLSVGDSVFAGSTVVAEADAEFRLQLTNGEELLFPTAAVAETELETENEPVADEVSDIQDAIAEGDFSEIEATAAGGSSSSGSDGPATIDSSNQQTIADSGYSTSANNNDSDTDIPDGNASVILDFDAPNAEFEDVVVNTTTPTLVGSVDDPNAVVTVSLNGGSPFEVINNGDGTYSFPEGIVFNEGVNDVVITATDQNGNQDTVSGTVTVDTIAPTGTVDSFSTDDTTPALSGTVSEPDAIVIVTINDETFQAVNNGDGTWTLPDNVVAELTEAVFDVSATFSDAMGNTSTSNGQVDVQINETPTAENVALSDISEDGSIIFTAEQLLANATDPDGDDLTVSDVSLVNPALGTLVDNNNGTWTFTPNPESSGPITFNFSVTDGEFTDSAQASLNVNPVNDPPTITVTAADIIETETTTSTVVATFNTSDVDSDNLIVTIENNDDNFFVIDGATVKLTPAGVAAVDNDELNLTELAIEISVSDGEFTVSDSDIINITRIDDTAPIGETDNATINEGASVVIDVASNDSDDEVGLDLTSIQIISTPANGTLVVNDDGTITYLHDDSDTTGDVFTYTIADNNGNVSDPITVNVAVNAIDDTKPIGEDDSASLNEGALISINIANNDADAESGLDLSSISIITQPNNGTLVINDDGTVDYQHDDSDTTSDSFIYTIKDNDGNESDPISVNLAIASVDDTKPIGEDDAGSLDEGAKLTLNIINNDFDSESGLDLSSIVITEQPGNGTLIINADGTVDYQHDGSDTTADTFIYTISDNDGNVSDPITVNLAIASVDDTAPIGQDDSATLDEGASVVINVASNDTDSESSLDLSSIQIINQPNNGSLVINDDGTVNYTHDSSNTTSDIFTYTIADSEGNASDPISVNIAVAPIDDTVSIHLTATDSVSEDNGNIVYTATLKDVFGNDVTTNENLDVTLDNGEVISIAVGQSSASVTTNVTRDDVFVETDSLSNSISSISGGDTFERLIAAENNQVTTVITDDSDTVTLTLNASNATTEDGGSITYTVELTNEAGESVLANSAVSIVLANGEELTIDSGNSSASITLDINRDDVYSENDVISNSIASVNDNGSFENLVVNSTNVTTTINDDVDVVTVSLSGDTQVLEGDKASFTISIDDSHVPTSDVVVTFTYTGTATDGTDYTGQASATISAGSTSQAFDVATLDDVFAEGSENFTISINTITGGGFESISANSAANSVETTIYDESNPDAPEPKEDPDTGEAPENNSENVTVSLSGDTQVLEGDKASFTISIDDSHVPTSDVVVTFTYTGTATDGTDYTGQASATISAGSTSQAFDVATLDDVFVEGTENFSIIIDSVNGGGFEAVKANADSNSVTTTIISQNAINDSEEIEEGSTAVGNVLTNDDPSLNVISYSINDVAYNIGEKQNIENVGSITINSNGEYIFEPLNNFNGSVPDIVYKVTGGNEAKLAINVNAATDLTAADDNFSATEDTVLNGSVAGNDSTTSGGTLSFVKASDPSHGTVTVNTDGTFSYTPNSNYTGSDSFTYTVTDADSGESLTQTVSVTVAAVTDLTAADDSFNATEDTVLNGSVAGNDSTTSGGTLSFAKATDPANGTVTVNTDGTFSYTPNSNYTGNDSFTYTV